jgi:zinc protease
VVDPNAVLDLKFEKYTLTNGLEVILLEDHRLPLAAVNLWYHVGPANERPGLTGFAHLFEHMMFEGSKHVGEKAHFQYLEAAGASDINGTTDFDRTNYFETLPSNQLELALWLESDRMGFLLGKVDARNLENQRDVVRNERRQTVENSPYGLVAEALFHLIYPKEHPYHASVIGSHADIESARLKDVREFFRLYYAPNNASLAIVGDIDPARTRELVEKYFGAIPAGNSVPPIEAKTPPIASERRAVVGDQVELPRIYMGWITDPVFQPGDAEADLIARILGGGKSSRLYRRLVYERRIAQDVAVHQYSLALGSLFTLESTAKPGVKPEDLEREIDEELEVFRSEGPSTEEVQAARNTIETAIVRGLETLGGFGGVADRLNLYNHFLHDPGFLRQDLARYAGATPDSLRAVARRRLGPNQRAVVWGVPGEKVIDDAPRAEHAGTGVEAEEPWVASQEWRAVPPGPGPASSLRLPVPVQRRLSNGLTVYLVSQRNLPIVSANFVVLSGSDRNPLDRPGLASFTAGMLDEGTARRGALDIARDAERLGASLSCGSSTDLSWVTVRVLTRNLDAAFELAADVLLQPVFPEHEVERVRHDRLTQILQHRDEPTVLATKVFCHEVYGSHHPYGFMEIGSERSNRAITPAELRRFWEAGYLPGNAALVVAGDVDTEELLELAEKYLGVWNRGATKADPPGEPEHGGRRVVVVDKPGTAQTSLRVGHTGIARANPDFVPVDVMNTALGGLFSSRINLNLREKHGFTYGAASTYLCRRGAGPFFVGTGVRTDVTGRAVEEIFRELALMRETELSGEELSRARDSIAQSLPGSFETSSQTASTIGQLFVHGLPDDYYRGLPEEINRVTAADVRRVADRHIRPDEMVVVAVGDASQILPQLETLQLGPIKVKKVDEAAAD